MGINFQNTEQGQSRMGFVSLFGQWLERSDMNMLLFKLVCDFLLATVWFVSMMIKTADVYSSLCPSVWNKDRCNEFVAEHYSPVYLSYFVPTIIFACVYFYMQRKYHDEPHRALQLFHVGMVVHMYLNLIFLLAIISVQAWVAMLVWIPLFTQDLVIFVRIHASVRVSHPDFGGVFDM
eukprot:c25518_g1_i1.p1 GENE.c25518_g1_i1~~c25518_g1_i1.p1  ORF type:complete len:178 (-),score=26.99 c25518_g1_i1:195-728(-)